MIDKTRLKKALDSVMQTAGSLRVGPTWYLAGSDAMVAVLRCEFLKSVGSMGERARLTFARKDIPRFAVVRADSELSVDGDLITVARPACA